MFLAVRPGLFDRDKLPGNECQRFHALDSELEVLGLFRQPDRAVQTRRQQRALTPRGKLFNCGSLSLAHNILMSETSNRNQTREPQNPDESRLRFRVAGSGSHSGASQPPGWTMASEIMDRMIEGACPFSNCH